MNIFATGLSDQVFKVVMPTGCRMSGSLTGSAMAILLTFRPTVGEGEPPLGLVRYLGGPLGPSPDFPPRASKAPSAPPHRDGGAQPSEVVPVV